MLQMGIARHQRLGMLLGHRHGGAQQVGDRRRKPQDQVPLEQPLGRRALVVAAACGLQKAGSIRPHRLRQHMLDMHQEGTGILQPWKALWAKRNNVQEPAQQCSAASRLQHLLLDEHHRVCDVDQQVGAITAPHPLELHHLVEFDEDRVALPQPRDLEEDLVLAAAHRRPLRTRMPAGISGLGGGRKPRHGPLPFRYPKTGMSFRLMVSNRVEKPLSIAFAGGCMEAGRRLTVAMIGSSAIRTRSSADRAVPNQAKEATSARRKDHTTNPQRHRRRAS